MYRLRSACADNTSINTSWAYSFAIQWNLSIKDTLNRGHLSNEDLVHSPNHIELRTNLHLN